MKDEEKRCENCIHNEGHLKAIQEGKQGSAICMLECNPSHICFRPKDLGKIKDEEKPYDYRSVVYAIEHILLVYEKDISPNLHNKLTHWKKNIQEELDKE